VASMSPRLLPLKRSIFMMSLFPSAFSLRAQENTHLTVEAGVFDDRSSSYPCSPRSEA